MAFLVAEIMVLMMQVSSTIGDRGDIIGVEMKMSLVVLQVSDLLLIIKGH